MQLSPLNAITSLIALLAFASAAFADGYTIVVSKKTLADPQWSKVVETLKERHRGEVISYESLDDTLSDLQKQFPRHTCFVATRDEATRQFVANVHRLTRKFDDDPYTDTLWGILTGYDAANALEIAATKKPLEVKRVAAGTEVALDRCQEGIWYCELEKHRTVRKKMGESAVQEKGPADTTKALADTLTEYQADLFVTSGHATERNWQIGFRYRNGYFTSKSGQLYGVDTEKKRFEINSTNPKVYMAVGNCLMGHVDGPDAMALAFMKSTRVNQMVGYTVLTWYGYGGWGCLDYFVEQPGRYTFAEAFHANHHALVHRLETEYPKIARVDVPPGKTTGYNEGGGLLHDRDVVAFYGDPAWDSSMADGPLNWEQKLTQNGDRYTLEIVPQRGPDTFHPVNKNGAQRGWRPIVHFLPHRLKDIKVISGDELKPVVADDFVLIPNPREHRQGTTYRVVFTAKKR
ncbi:MAG: hypothetical protein ACI9HK_002647 [Pirellulaceae bacterium]|jgi:hypothetical protein